MPITSEERGVKLAIHFVSPHSGFGTGLCVQ
jgi:hypothetical protein